MSRRLPPLNSLRVFEAAARHLSFTRAAEELFVTQAAVSHQIKALEEFLSLKLFRRRNRSLLLTEEGQSYFLDIKDIFTSIAEATDKVLERSEKVRLPSACHQVLRFSGWSPVWRTLMLRNRTSMCVSKRWIWTKDH
ncbi:Transcriptional regulator [Vibrio sp. B1FLJ16]|nr:Transcriptional regulator [Vibrio sp. B1FLJ16]CAE6889283.1 Transcriptional regulator [Vibrio sp. B1FLJ16]